MAAEAAALAAQLSRLSTSAAAAASVGSQASGGTPAAAGVLTSSNRRSTSGGSLPAPRRSGGVVPVGMGGLEVDQQQLSVLSSKLGQLTLCLSSIQQQQQQLVQQEEALPAHPHLTAAPACGVRYAPPPHTHMPCCACLALICASCIRGHMLILHSTATTCVHCCSSDRQQHPSSSGTEHQGAFHYLCFDTNVWLDHPRAVR